MAWLDFLGNIGNNVKTGTRKLFSNLMQEKPELATIQMADNGGLDVQGSLKLGMAMPKSLKDRLVGRTVSVDVESTNPETNEMEVSRVSKFQPGLLNDIAAGARENFATGFAAPNWEESRTPDGRTKGFGYRFGEGLGSMAKFAESPLGRSLLMGAIVGASGGSGLEALGYGAGAGLGNQQARMKDKMYRNELEKMGFDTTGITGYVGDDTFNKIFQSKQLQDNAEYRNAMLASQQRNQELANRMAQDRLEYQKLSDAADRALKARGLDIQEQKIPNTNNKEEAKRRQSQSTLNMIGTALNTVDQNPEAYGFWKGMAPNDITNRADAKGVQARAVIDSVTAEYRKYLTGAQMSDKERKDYEKFLPNPRDNADIIRRKLQGMQTVIQAREGLYGYVPQEQTGNTTNIDAIVNKLKQNGYSDAEISEYLKMKGY